MQHSQVYLTKNSTCTSVNWITKNGTSKYYLGTSNVTGAEIWESSDGVNWTKVEGVGCVNDGFGFTNFERCAAGYSVNLGGGKYALYVSLEDPDITDYYEGVDVRVYRKIDY